MRSVIILAVTLLGLLALSACAEATPTPSPGPTFTPTPEPRPSELMRVLGSTPASFKDAGIVFSDLGRALELAGGLSLEECYGGPEVKPEACRDAIVGMPVYSGLLGRSANYAMEWKQAFGFNYYDPGLVVSTGNHVIGALPDSASYIEGRFDESVVRQKLLGLGYEEKEVAGYTYYSIRNDFQFDMDDPVSRMALYTMNRVYLENGLLIATPTTAQMEAYLEAWADGPALAEDATFSGLTRSLGDPLAAALMTEDALWEPVQEELDSYQKPSDWGSLHQWDALAVGYGKTDGEAWYRFSLHYGDPGAAEADAQELVERMQDYRLSFDDLKTSQPPEQAGTPESSIKPFEEECLSLTPQVREEADGSTLTVQCDLKTGRGEMWLIMVETRLLLFLVP